ncbi:MAG TPA: fibronectin type III domain-containing protein [Candidatus Binatia bacterium]|jgi:hypothetical protein
MVTLSLAAVLVGGVIACSTPPQGAPGGATAQNAPEQCSTFGVMACKAMTLFSSDSVSTCRVSGGPGTTRIETCGSVPIAGEKAESAPAGPKAYPVHIAWSDNSDNESNFVIERCDQISIASTGEQAPASCAGPWRSIATVGANTTSYVDKTASANQTYIYRIKAINSNGSSGYTQEKAITTPPR